MENLKQYLSNIYENYLADLTSKQGVNAHYKAKCLGAMEALLVTLEVLRPGTPFVYHKNERIIKVLWLFEFHFEIEESYEEHILRLTAETLKKI